jgi:hypothetical protein
MATTMAAARRAMGYNDYGDDDGGGVTGDNEVDGDGATGDNNDGQQR